MRPSQSTYQRRRRLAETVGDEGITKLAVAERDGYICHLCQQHVEIRDLSIDHVRPLSEGGSHVWANVRCAHKRCNSARHHVHPQVIGFEACVGQRLPYYGAHGHRFRLGRCTYEVELHHDILHIRLVQDEHFQKRPLAHVTVYRTVTGYELCPRYADAWLTFGVAHDQEPHLLFRYRRPR